jgi:hypothetical protein
MRFRLLLALTSLALAGAQAQSPAPATQSKQSSAATKAAADRMQQKLDYLKQNSEKAKPDQRPTVLLEDEINAYFAEGRVKLPEGLERIIFKIAAGNVTSDMTVNFDTLTAHSSNPLLSLFSGIHQVEVYAHGEGSGGMARAHIDSVSLDGSQIPRFLLEMFVERMLQPKYPQASLDPTFKLLERIDLVTLGEHKATVTQK